MRAIKARAAPAAILIVPVLAALFVACGSTQDLPTSDAPAERRGGDAGTCDEAKEPKDSPGCLASELGIFVDGVNGNDAAAGTREEPARTLGAALAKLAGRTRIFVCGAGPYAESLRLDAQTTASIHGGFSCTDWSYVGTPAEVTPSTPGFVLAVSGTKRDIILSDLALAAPADSAPGASSIAIFGYASSRVTLRRSTIQVGRGNDGADGEDAPAFTPARAPAGRSGMSGASAMPNPKCPTSIGGAGGIAGASGRDGAVAVSTAMPANYLGRGTPSTSGGVCPDKIQDGSYGAGGLGGVGAATIGSFDGTGWTGTDGAPGRDGAHGQGGGGGHSTGVGYGGGGGSPGGCGGRGGAPGQAGGSSIGILALQTTFALESTTLKIADAGRGGHGGAGQKGQMTDLGGDRAPAEDFQHTCAGGRGGVGGGGGGAGGGSGGMSIGILFAGSAPLVDGALTGSANVAPNVVLGAAGAGGDGGDGGAAVSDPGLSIDGFPGISGTSGVGGQAKAVLEFQ